MQGKKVYIITYALSSTLSGTTVKMLKGQLVEQRHGNWVARFDSGIHVLRSERLVGSNDNINFTPEEAYTSFQDYVDSRRSSIKAQQLLYDNLAERTRTHKIEKESEFHYFESEEATKLLQELTETFDGTDAIEETLKNRIFKFLNHEG